MHPLPPSSPAVDDPAAPRLVLRDGTVASVRRSTSDDRAAMRRFFHELSSESRRRRFFTEAEPTDVLVDRLCDSADEQRSVTLDGNEVETHVSTSAASTRRRARARC